MSWFGAEADRIYTHLGHAEAEDQVQRVLELARAQGEVTARELMHSNRKQYPTAEAAKRQLEDLVRAGRMERSFRRPGPRGGHPTIAYRLK